MLEYLYSDCESNSVKRGRKVIKINIYIYISDDKSNVIQNKQNFNF